MAHAILKFGCRRVCVSRRKHSHGKPAFLASSYYYSFAKLFSNINIPHVEGSSSLVETSYADVFDILSEDMKIFPDFVSQEEEDSLLKEVEKSVKRLRYEFNHWDNAIHGYRETEQKKWNEVNTQIINKVRCLAFTAQDCPLTYIHILDLAKDGYIKPHVDAKRFCGDTIAGMSLMSSSVMRLALESNKEKFANLYLPQRSLYIMKNRARYDFTHEILKEEESYFGGKHIPKDRRVSVICRNEPRPEDTL